MWVGGEDKCKIKIYTHTRTNQVKRAKGEILEENWSELSEKKKKKKRSNERRKKREEITWEEEEEDKGGDHERRGREEINQRERCVSGFHLFFWLRPCCIQPCPSFFSKKKKKELGHACSRVGHELGNPSAMSVLSRILVICLFGKRDFWEGRETQSDSVKETRVFVMICFFGKVNWEVWGGVVGETWVVTFTILFGLILYNYISILNFLYYHVVQIF